MAPRAVIFGCEGPSPTDWETEFFGQGDPLGFVLFSRNCESPAQVKDLVAALRGSIGRDDAPVLIDQEGGRVQRLCPPHWRAAPPPGLFGDLAQSNGERAREAVEVNAHLLAAELTDLGINVNCMPLLDLRMIGGHKVIGDRSFGADPELVASLGRACCEGLMAGGVMPVVKHMPGHGRALVDSHEELAKAEATCEELERTDFAPFRTLADIPWGMTAHVVYTAIDPLFPATTSAKVISGVIRGTIGFDGLLLSDDLSMKALQGDLGSRAVAALGAGCDVALHCNGDRAEMEAIVEAVGPLSPDGERRWKVGAGRLGPPQPADREALAARLDTLLAGA